MNGFYAISHEIGYFEEVGITTWMSEWISE